MDRDGILNLEAQYREELATAKEKARAELEEKYSKYRYVGTAQMQAQAKANMARQMEEEIKDRVAEFEQRINHFHFKDYGGRDEAMQLLKRKEKETAYEQRLQEYFKEQSADRSKDKKGRGR